MMEYKILRNADVKLSGDGFGTIAGYASTFNNWDAVGERPVKGAFAPHLEDFMRDGFISVGHDWAGLPIATPLEAREDDHGLFVKAAFHSTAEAQTARTVINERIERGKSVKLSIGYEVLDDEFTKDGRLLKEIKLHEWSYVSVPANPLAAVTYAKGHPGSDLPFAEYTDSVVSTVEAFITRAQNRQAFRAKEGRVLSSATRSRIQTLKEALASVLTDLDELLRATERNDQPIDNAEVRALFEQQEALFAKLRIIT